MLLSRYSRMVVGCAVVWAMTIGAAPQASRAVAALAVGDPLPLTCSGSPAPANCLLGYVYYGGVPVAGAQVKVESRFGEANLQTATGAASAQPYYATALSTAPLLATTGETITVTAIYLSSVVTVTGVAVPGGLQLDAVYNVSPLFGNGEDGDFAGTDPNSERAGLASTAAAGQKTITTSWALLMTVGDEVLVIQMQGVGAGQYEFGQVAGLSDTTVTLSDNLAHTYTQDSVSKAQVLRVPHFRTVTGSLATGEWTGTAGGVLVFRALAVTGVQVGANGGGFKAGYGNDAAVHFGPCTNGNQGQQGHSPTGAGICYRLNNGGGGGGAGPTPGGSGDFGSGGGGGHAQGGSTGSGPLPGLGGSAYGTNDFSSIFMGSGGGGGAWGTNPYGGGRGTSGGSVSDGQGGAIVLIYGLSIQNLSVNANGQTGGASSGGYGGGGGAGGSVYVVGRTVSLSTVQATGGAGGAGAQAQGGAGSAGRIRVEYETLTGTSNPTPVTQVLDFTSAPIATINAIYPASAGQSSVVTFVGTGSVTDLGGGGITSYVWRSDLDGVLSSSAAFTRTASSLSAGTHTIYLKVRDSHSNWSTEIARTLVVGTAPAPTATPTGGPTPSGTFRVQLPTLLRTTSACYSGASEREPNNAIGQATGLLCSGLTYTGFANDSDDFYAFDLDHVGNINVALDNPSGTGTQLVLYAGSTPVAQSISAPFRITHAATVNGHYYVRVYTVGGFNSTSPYSLHVTFP